MCPDKPVSSFDEVWYIDGTCKKKSRDTKPLYKKQPTLEQICTPFVVAAQKYR